MKEVKGCTLGPVGLSKVGTGTLSLGGTTTSNKDDGR